ncbi:MAG TPA: ribonuclease H-like domain-containing protein [Rudaea sp.]|jgi:hypothetical protein
MSVSLERLLRLRQQAGLGVGMPARIAPNAAKPQPAGVTIDVLRRLLGTRGRLQTAIEPAAGMHSPDRTLSGEQILPGLFLVDRLLPWPKPCDAIVVDAKTYGPIEPSNALCFDTETTGLAGGAGTRAFMVGISEWTADGLRVRQLLTATLGAEAAMLRTLADWIEPRHVLVSYNGRCYDSPLLATRYRLARMTNPLANLPHADLLFAVRRRYRGVWENCRLGTVERRLLQVVREDDLPGSEAPAAWLRYLRGGDAINLRRVLAHNHQDVVSLMLLLGALAAPGPREGSCDESATALAR